MATGEPSDVPGTPTDSVDRLLDGWHRVRPELDFAPVGVVARLARVRAVVDHELEAVFAEHGLSGPSFAMLVTLARLGDPDGVSQRRLMEELRLTSGTVSVRIDRLVEAGLVERRPDPDDGRGALVRLTAAGRERFEAVTPVHLATERWLLSALSDAEQAELAGLLRRLLVSFEGSAAPEDARVRLGLVLAPAHVAVQMRRAVGLPERTGLLVRAVEPGPAAAAGLEPGDVLVAAGERELRAVATLYAALDEARASGELTFAIVRGVEERTVAIALDRPAPAPAPAPVPAPAPAPAERAPGVRRAREHWV